MLLQGLRRQRLSKDCQEIDGGDKEVTPEVKIEMRWRQRRGIEGG